MEIEPEIIYAAFIVLWGALLTLFKALRKMESRCDRKLNDLWAKISLWRPETSCYCQSTKIVANWPDRRQAVRRNPKALNACREKRKIRERRAPALS